MKLKKVLALVIAGAMAISTAACGNSNSTTTEAVEETEAANTIEESGIEVDETRELATKDNRLDSVTVALDADPIDLLPHSPNNQNKGYITRLIYEPLFYCEDNIYYPILAEGYEVVDDTHWKVTLRDDIYDTDNNHITADDVVYSYDWLVDTGYVNRFDAYGGVEKTGDYEVVFTWTSPVDGLAEVDSPLSSFVFSEKAFNDHNFATDPVGTGPYKLEKFTAGSEITVVANDDYWAYKAGEDLCYRQQSNVEKIIYKIITEASQNVTGLATGNLDMSMNIPSDSMAEFSDGGMYADDFNVTIRNATAVCWLTWNETEGKITADENFRLACAYALNNEAIAKVGGLYTAATAFCSPSAGEWGDDLVVNDGYITTTDLDLAKEYLDKTAYNGETLYVLSYNSEAYKNIATMIVTCLSQIGINAEVKAVDNNDFDADMGDPDAFDMASGYFGGAYLPSGLNRIINYGDFIPDAGAGFIRDKELLTLWQTCNTTETYTHENVKACLDYMYDKVYFYPTAVQYVVAVTSNKVASVFYQTATTTIWPNACDYYVSQ